jgi:toxin CptA
MKSARAIAFEYRPSRRLAAIIASVAVAATFAIALSAFDLLAKLALVFAALAYTGIVLRKFWNQLPLRVAWHDAGHWRVADTSGDHAAELVRSAVRGGWIVLNLRCFDGARIALVLAPDNSDADTHRRLRVRLAHSNS